jgi:Ser/Thr protein kinase RdoA (MazF antagonist)
MKPFRELTRRSRLYRLRALAKEALKTYEINDARLSFIQYFENIIYRVDLPIDAMPSSGASPYTPGRYLLRIHAMSEMDAIDSELTWLAALSQEAGLCVPAPVLTTDGKYLASIITPDIPKGRVVSLMRWLDGRRIRNGLRPKHLTALGKAVAQMHTFSAGWHPPRGFTRPNWDWEAQLGGSMFEHPLEELVESMPAKFHEPFQIISREAKQVMAALSKDSDTYGLIHADLYPENVLYKAGKAYPIDFEDCGYGYWMWDNAVALCQWAWGQDWKPMRDAFREGYDKKRRLPEVQWAQLDLFVATQFATMLLWASAFLKHDPKRVAEYTPWRDESGNKLLGYFSRSP